MINRFVYLAVFSLFGFLGGCFAGVVSSSFFCGSCALMVFVFLILFLKMLVVFFVWSV